MKTSQNKMLPPVSSTCFDDSFLQRNRLHKPQPTLIVHTTPFYKNGKTHKISVSQEKQEGGSVLML